MSEEKADGFNHYSVMLEEAVEGLNVRPDGTYVDGTLGGGGHAFEILSRLNGKGSLIGIDQDSDAIVAAAKKLEGFGNRLTIIRSNYGDIREITKRLGVESVDGILLDLGVSSFQLDKAERGFSYKLEAPLDMRMDSRMSMTAYDIVNGYSESELYRVIRDYGEDRFAKNIAKHIANERKNKTIKTTTELAEIVKGAIPAKMRAGKGHPAKQTFQAIRIELNRELDVLQNTLDEMVELLSPGGRICVITFHSLEDRIVKSAFRRFENPCTCPPDFPVCRCGAVSRGRIVTKKPITPSEKELEENLRSRSAKLRIFEKA